MKKLHLKKVRATQRGRGYASVWISWACLLLLPCCHAGQEFVRLTARWGPTVMLKSVFATELYDLSIVKRKLICSLFSGFGQKRFFRVVDGFGNRHYLIDCIRCGFTFIMLVFCHPWNTGFHGWPTLFSHELANSSYNEWLTNTFLYNYCHIRLHVI